MTGDYMNHEQLPLPLITNTKLVNHIVQRIYFRTDALGTFAFSRTSPML